MPQWRGVRRDGWFFFCRLKINASQMMITLKTFWGGGVALGSLSDSK